MTWRRVANGAGVLFRFVRDMKVGDIVVYPAKATREVHIGRVTGEYQYRPDVSKDYPNQRPVQWDKVVPRDVFSPGARFEIGAAITLFQIRRYADEFQKALAGKAPVAPPGPGGEEPPSQFQFTAESIEEWTRDFVLERLAQQLKGTPLEEFVQNLLEAMGYRARLAPPNEPNVDLIAHRDELGLEPPIIKVQGKGGSGKVTDMEVSALSGKLSRQEYGLLVTLGSFTPQALQYAAGRSHLRLIDGTGLVDLVFQHYEQLDPRFKSVLPLKRVYAPAGVPEEQ